VIEPRQGPTSYDREYTLILGEWDLELTPDVATGAAPRGPRDQSLRGGELGSDLFLINGKMHGFDNPIRIAEGERVLIRLINAGHLAHPFHTHGHSFTVVATDGNPVPEAARLTKDTILVAPGERYDIAFTADNPGVWMAHCHIEHHAANGMMTLIQYAGAKPTGPLRELWDLTPTPGTEPPPVGGHGGHGAPAAETPAAAPTTAAAAPGGTDVWLAMEDDRFDPKSLTVKVGTTVTWINKGADWHSVAAFDGSFESAQIAPGESFARTFDAPGVYKFICQHHARHGMMGQIVVTA
jgi:plastocyanin